jgi:crooked neck
MADSGPPAKKLKLPKAAKVKNKLPAEVQITAEQLLREANDRKLETVAPPPKQKITNQYELKDYQMRKRKEFEDNIRKNRTVMSNWIKYARWEESQQEFARARSVFERAIDVDHRNIPVWLKYAEMEMRHRQVNHARNVWDRAVTILPRANQFWFKYTYMEEMLGNIAGARQVFERWMQWEPEEQAWLSYIKMELRYKEVDRARGVYERFVLVHPFVKNWIRFAKFEHAQGSVQCGRQVYERAVEFYGDEHLDEELFTAFAHFEENCKEYERARVIYQYAIDRISKENAKELLKAYTQFEKKFGSKAGIESVIVNKRKFQYEEEVKANPMNYDAWFDLIRLLESEGTTEQVREVYEQAIANVPPAQEKRFWRRYIYLWIYYALYEELVMKDVDRTRQVYQACLELIPHKKFTFAKIWVMFAHFEIRQKDTKAARRILGTAIGKCPKPKLFKCYIELELQLREFDRCRKLYEKFLEYGPANCTTWVKYAELETILGDADRARAIFELAVGQPMMDMPEVLWKAFIDFEIEQEEVDNVRDLYKRLLERTLHVKVWISYAKFEQGLNETNRARTVFEDADKTLRAEGAEAEQRSLLLEAWREMEADVGDLESLEKVTRKIPRKVKKRRKVQNEDGSDGGWEEYWDYLFPDDSTSAPSLKLLEMARAWKQKQLAGEDDDSDDSDSEGDGSDDKETTPPQAIQHHGDSDSTGSDSDSEPA